LSYDIDMDMNQPHNQGPDGAGGALPMRATRARRWRDRARRSAPAGLRLGMATQKPAHPPRPVGRGGGFIHQPRSKRWGVQIARQNPMRMASLPGYGRPPCLLAAPKHSRNRSLPVAGGAAAGRVADAVGAPGEAVDQHVARPLEGASQPVPRPAAALRQGRWEGRPVPRAFGEKRRGEGWGIPEAENPPVHLTRIGRDSGKQGARRWNPMRVCVSV